MKAEQYILLYEKYLAGECTPEEERMLFAEQDKEFRLYESIEGQDPQAEKDISGRVYRQILNTIEMKRKRVVRLRLLYVAATSVVLVIVAGLFNKTSLSPADESGKIVAVSEMPKIKPGGNTAVLTLSDGSMIELDKSATGLIASEGNIGVKKLADGRIVYEAGRQDNDHTALLLNTISTPRGGQYNLTLPDGSMVWLNSESVLSFPASFSGKERKVSLKGEAYFEVAKDASKPFRVEMGALNVEVLGTHFNVRAFPVEAAVYTTLLEGSVKLNKGSNGKLLSPGEQGISRSSTDVISVSKVRVNEVVAWKNGLFVFRESTIKEIMEQFARWYDVEVEYRGDVEGRTFGGVYSKNKDLKELLISMELTGLVHFKAEGRRIIVMP